jgi:sec-independent protein translocase protein TatA
MANIGPLEIVVVLIIALVVFGPKRLPELGKSLGKGIHEFRGTISGESAAPAPAAAVEESPVVEPPVVVAPGQVAEADAPKARV